MANPLSRLFSGKRTGKIDDVPSFLAALARAWNSAVSFNPAEAERNWPSAAIAARLLFQRSDRPAAVVAGPAVDVAGLDDLASFVGAALLLLAEEEGHPRTIAVSGESIIPEYRDYRIFSSSPEGLLILFDEYLEDRFRTLLGNLGPKGLAAEAASSLSRESVASLPASPSSERLEVTEGSAAYASRFFFPSAFLAGETPVRFVPRSYRLDEPEEAADSEAWFRFGLRMESESLGGFWALSRPESIPPDRFPALAASLAKAAGAALAAEYAAARPGGKAVSAAAPAEAPHFGASPTFTVEGTVAVGAAVLNLRVVVPRAYPLRLASFFGRTETDGVSAVLALDRVLAPRLEDRRIDARALRFPGGGEASSRPGGGVLFLPFYEYLGLLSDGDYRRIVQNFLIRRCRRQELAELFFYREGAKAQGGPRPIAVRPQAFDIGRFLSFLPDSVRNSYVAAVRGGVASGSAERFLYLNEEIYEDAVRDLRRGSLAIGYRAGTTLERIRSRYVSPRKRGRLDAMIKADHPFALLRSLPPRLFRSVVDASNFVTLAASLVGREEEIVEIEGWCSARKLRNIREELEKATALLERGEGDADALCGLRDRLARKAKEVQERDRLERSARNGGGRG